MFVAVWTCLALPLPSFEPQEIRGLWWGSALPLKPLHRKMQLPMEMCRTWSLGDPDDFSTIGSVNEQMMFEYLNKTFFFLINFAFWGVQPEGKSLSASVSPIALWAGGWMW